MDGIYVDAPLFKSDAEQIAKDTRLLHQHYEDEEEDYIDEGADDENTFTHEFQGSWRERKGRNTCWNKHEFSRFTSTDWRNAKVAAKHLKFCPGDNCRIWLPLYHFSSNCNMEDGLDIYCIECNYRKRNERRTKRSSSNYITQDKYERFFEEYKLRHPEPEEPEERAVMREVNKRIGTAIEEAAARFKRKVPVDAIEVARRLFMRRRFVCTVTGQVLSPTCFLDHHFVTFQLKETDTPSKTLEIICNDCRLGSPPE